MSDKLANLKSLVLADNCIGKAGIQALVGKVGPGSQLGVLNLKSQQQALGEEDMDDIMEQLAKALGICESYIWFETDTADIIYLERNAR